MTHYILLVAMLALFALAVCTLDELRASWRQNDPWLLLLFLLAIFSLFGAGAILMGVHVL